MQMNENTENSIARESLRLRNPFVQPLPGTETQVADIFSRVMGVMPVGADDDFYDLGGDSLLGEQISMEILRVTGKVFPISGLFESGTPRALAAHLSGATQERQPGASARETFFIVHGRGGYTVLRPTFKAGMTSGARVVMLELPGIRGDAPFPRSVPDIARAYVDQIEREQPHGPVRLASFCMGGLIALEMAHLLEQRGRTLGGLVLLDPGLPRSLRYRHRALRMVEADGASLRAKLILFGSTGRLSEADPFLEPLWIRVRASANMSSSLRKLLGMEKKALYRNAGLKDWPRAWLTATYRHAWPRPSGIRAHILASEGRAKSFLKRDGVWEHLLPNRSVYVLVGRHNEIGGESSHVAAALETLLLGGELARDMALSPPFTSSGTETRAAAGAVTATAAS